MKCEETLFILEQCRVCSVTSRETVDWYLEFMNIRKQICKIAQKAFRKYWILVFE